MNPRVHIAVVFGSSVSFGGGYQYALSVLDAVTAFPADRYTITIISSNEEWSKHLEGKNIRQIHWHEAAFAAIIRKTFYNIPWGIRLWRKVSGFIHPLYRVLRQTDYSIVIFPVQAHFSLGWAGTTIAPIHDLMHRYERKFPEVGNLYENIRRERTYSRLCRYCDGILVDSNLGKSQLIQSYGIEADRVFVLPYSSPPYLQGNGGFFQDVRERYGLPDRFIFYPAQLWQHKNHRGLLEALVLLRNEGTIVNAVFCGVDKNAGAAISNFVASSGLEKQVIHLNYVSNEDMVSFYKAAVALVMPTFFGPTNIPPLEAFELGCPVAVSNVYAMPEQVGDAALLFDPHNSKEIAEKIRVLWTNEDVRNDLIQRGHLRASMWDRGRFSLRLREILEKVSGKS